jgi:ATP-binding cassette subfamily B protein
VALSALLAGPRRRWLAPEVVQISAMDCGPAALKCLLEGFGIPVSYGRLQEACQTTVDGTSIDVIEELAVALGLDAEQIMTPVDHALRAEALPALIVTREASDMTHFLVAWSRHGARVQVMDPARGRRWLRWEQLAEQVHLHGHAVPGADWRAWAGSSDFLDPLRARVGALGVDPAASGSLLREACADPEWRGLAALDAATRMVESLARSGGLARGRDAARVLRAVVARARDPQTPFAQSIPAPYWSVWPPRGGQDPGSLTLRGAVLVRVRGRRAGAAAELGEPAQGSARTLSPELTAALRQRPPSPVRAVLRFLREDGVLTPVMLLLAALLATGGVLVEILLFRSFFEMGRVLELGEQRLGAAAVLLAFSIALLAVDIAIAGGVFRLGRGLEARLRLALLRKLPRLGDRYFQSRLVSDMAQRAHGLHLPRTLPDLGTRLVRSIAQLVLTAAAIAWIDPPSAPLALLGAVLALALPIAVQPLLAERELAQRSHGAALSRVYLDALLGLAPARTHGAERSLRRAHESLLVGWARGGRSLLQATLAVEGVQALATLLVVIALIAAYIARGGEPAGSLLLVYWALTVPALGKDVAQQLRQYTASRNVVARLLEPLGAASEGEGEDQAAAAAGGPAWRAAARERGVALALDGVAVRVAGHRVLEDVQLSVAPGEHVAIVGLSGAGKSSLVGLFLGWHRPTAGRVLVDDAPLTGSRLAALRRETAWVDPSVQLWNRPLLDNVRYGNAWPPAAPLPEVIDAAELLPVLERLPRGLQSPLGEGGALTSGGEGQRVRFARALLRPGARLVILDEPFRGLDRVRRAALLRRARAAWPRATLLCVTHDVSETRAFDRVLVIEGGRVVEDGAPAELADKVGSRYGSLLDAEEAVQAELRASAGWQRWRLEGGRLHGEGRA